MVCVWVAFHKKKDGNHENNENDEDNSDSYKQGVECWIRGNHGNHGNDETHGNLGCKPPQRARILKKAIWLERLKTSSFRLKFSISLEKFNLTRNFQS